MNRKITPKFKKSLEFTKLFETKKLRFQKHSLRKFSQFDKEQKIRDIQKTMKPIKKSAKVNIKIMNKNTRY